MPFKSIVHPKISAAFHVITINGNLKLSKRIKKHNKSSIEVVLMTQRLYTKPSAVIQHLCFYGAFVSYVEAKSSVCIKKKEKKKKRKKKESVPSSVTRVWNKMVCKYKMLHFIFRPNCSFK